MERIIAVLVVCSFVISCGTKKVESNVETDSLTIDPNESMQATDVAPPLLASTPIFGYAIKNSVPLSDTVNFHLIPNQVDLDKNFEPTKASEGKPEDPDFTINYIIGVTCMPSDKITTIAIDTVHVTPEEIGVYLTIKRGEMQNLKTKATQIFAIERRDGIASMQFYVNGKKDKSIFLAGL